jgi:TonB family protein
MLRAFPLLALAALLAVTSMPAAANELEQHLRDEYQGKTLVLRGFHSGDRLRYDSAGAPGNAGSGDWTTDGFVLVSEIHVSELRLKIKAKRLSVALGPKGTFEFLADNPKAQKKAPPLQIEAELPQVNPSVEQVDAALSKVFLTGQDSFADLVPDYWKPCIPDGLSGKISKCFFSPEFGAIPGFESQGQHDSAPSAGAGSVSPVLSDVPLFKTGHGVSPPRAIFQHEPEFSEPARLAKYQGVVTLGLIVDRDGHPTSIHILSPLGCGLDAKAVEAVGTWRFEPARKDGEPVRVSIAVEVDFHLY